MLGRSNRLSPRVQRRRIIRYYWIGAAAVFAILLFVFLGWLSGRPWALIQEVVISGNEATVSGEIVATADSILGGKYFHLFSRRNVVLYPHDETLEALVLQYPQFKEIDVGLDWSRILHIDVVERVPIALWCGNTPSSDTVVFGTATEFSPIAVTTESCYFMDENGYVFSPAPEFSGTGYIRYYGMTSSSTPLASNFLLGKFTAVRALLDDFEKGGLAPTRFIVTPEHFYDVTLSGTGQAYLEPDQDPAVTLSNLRTVLHSDDFKKDSAEHPLGLDYIDLRFGNKVFYKFK